MLCIRNLSASIEGKEILRGLNLHIRAGEVHAIMGPNGSGKSTFAQVLAGRDLYKVVADELTFEGRDLLQMAPEMRARWSGPVGNWIVPPRKGTRSVRRASGPTAIFTMRFATNRCRSTCSDGPTSFF